MTKESRGTLFWIILMASFRLRSLYPTDRKPVPVERACLDAVKWTKTMTKESRGTLLWIIRMASFRLRSLYPTDRKPVPVERACLDAVKWTQSYANPEYLVTPNIDHFLLSTTYRGSHVQVFVGTACVFVFVCVSCKGILRLSVN